MNIPENFDRWMFDYLEGNLTASELESFEQFLAQNPDFESDADAWQQTFIGGEEIAYPNQQTLEKKKRVIGWYGWSAAAMVIALVGLGGFLMNRSNGSVKNNATLAQNDFTAPNVTPVFTKHEFARTIIAATTTDYRNDINEENTEGNSQHSAAASSNENGSGIATSGSENNYLATNGSNHTNSNDSDLNNNSNQSDLANFANYATHNSGSNATGAENSTNGNSDNNSIKKQRSLKQEQEKYKSDQYGSKYIDNPLESAIDLDLSKKNKVKYNSFGSTTKRLYRKIERMMGYPVGLVNLRDPELIVPENSLVSFNPGFTGGMLRPRYEINYRNQWFGSETNAHKASFGFDNYVTNLKGGVGIMVNSTTLNNGEFSDQSINLTYSPKISLSKNVVFEPGVKVSLGLLSGRPSADGETAFEVDRGLLLNSIPAAASSANGRQWYKDYGLGFVLNTKWFYAGFSADNLSGHYANVFAVENPEPTVTPVFLSGIIGADYESNNKSMTLSPFVSYRQFGERYEFWGGANYRLNHFTLGASYSSIQDYAVTVGMKFKKFKMIYRYDNTTTLTTNTQIASHNIGIRFNGGAKNARFKY